MNRYEEENGPFCSTDLKPIRQSEIPTKEWIRPETEEEPYDWPAIIGFNLLCCAWVVGTFHWSFL